MSIELGKPADYGQYILQRRYELALKHAGEAMSTGGLYLDVGCGNGAQTVLFAKHFTTWIGIDVEEARHLPLVIIRIMAVREQKHPIPILQRRIGRDHWHALRLPFIRRGVVTRARACMARTIAAAGRSGQRAQESCARGLRAPPGRRGSGSTVS